MTETNKPIDSKNIPQQFTEEEIMQAGKSARNLVDKLSQTYLNGIDLFQPYYNATPGKNYREDKVSCIAWSNDEPYCVTVRRTENEIRNPDNHVVLAVGKIPANMISKEISRERLQEQAPLYEALGLNAARMNKTAFGSFISFAVDGQCHLVIPSVENGTTSQQVVDVLDALSTVDAQQIWELDVVSQDWSNFRKD